MSNDGGAAAILGRYGAEAQVRRRGILLILSSPSGAGKSTLARRLRVADPSLALSVSCTTRPARPGEVEGVDYRFVDTAAFRAAEAAGDMLETAEVFGNLYGTPRPPVMAWLEEGRDVLFDVDWQGARQLREALPGDVVSVFILPPSLDSLSQRLRDRGQDDAAVIADRMSKARAEISHWSEYDYIIVNDDLDAAEARIGAIVMAERLRRSRRTGLSALVAEIGGGDG